MTLQTQQPTPEHSPAVLTDEQRRRVADALENAQSVNTRRNYAGQFRKFCEWCEHRDRPRCRHRPKSWRPILQSSSAMERACRRYGSRSRP